MSTDEQNVKMIMHYKDLMKSALDKVEAFEFYNGTFNDTKCSKDLTSEEYALLNAFLEATGDCLIGEDFRDQERYAAFLSNLKPIEHSTGPSLGSPNEGGSPPK